jgi:hypothetical protein
MICERPRAHVMRTRPAKIGIMNTRLIISLLCAGALAFACGPRSHSDAPSTLASMIPMPHRAADTARPVAHQRAGKNGPKPEAKIDSRLDVSVAQHDVHLALDLRNVGNKHAELTFPSGQTYDFIVVDSVGREVWRWSTRRMFTQGVQNRQLGAGETMQVAETWKQGAKPGRYTAIATLRSSNFPVEQRVDFVMH